jgi:hypothetical protein
MLPDGIVQVPDFFSDEYTRYVTRLVVTGNLYNKRLREYADEGKWDTLRGLLGRESEFMVDCWKQAESIVRKRCEQAQNSREGPPHLYSEDSQSDGLSGGAK